MWECFRCCFTFLITLGFSAFFLWLSFHTQKPSCSIKAFYLPALDRSLKSSINATIFMNLTLKNTNKEKGIFYDPVNITVHYFQNTNITLWHGQIPGFYQGFQKTATKKVSVLTSGVNWTDVVAKNDTVVFRVDLATRVRFKIMGLKTKRQGMRRGANVTVSDSGAKNKKKGINLKSGVPTVGGYCWKVGILISVLTYGVLLHP